MKYEKLPKLCFGCGYIIHEEGGCKSQGPKARDQLWAWLRAEVQLWPCLRKGEGGSSDQWSKVNIDTPVEGEPLVSRVAARGLTEDLN